MYDQENKQKIWVSGLLLLGILYCSASDKAKANSYFEVVQEGLNEQISASDRDIKEVFPRLLIFANTMTYHFTAIKLGKDISETKEAEEEQQFEEIFEEIYNEMLDDIFDNSQRMTRTEFTNLMAGRCKKYINAGELRKLVEKKIKDKDIKSYLRDQISE